MRLANHLHNNWETWRDLVASIVSYASYGYYAVKIRARTMHVDLRPPVRTFDGTPMEGRNTTEGWRRVREF